MVCVEYLFPCTLLWWNLFITIITYNGVLTLPLTLKPRNQYPVPPTNQDEFKLPIDRTQLQKNDYNIPVHDTALYTLDGTEKTAAQYEVSAKSNSVDLTKSNDNNEYMPIVHKKPFRISSTDEASGKTISAQTSTIYKKKKDSRIPKVGGSKDIIAQVIEKFLGDLSNQSNPSILVSHRDTKDDLPSVHSSKRRAVSDWGQNIKTVQLAVRDEHSDEGHGGMAIQDEIISAFMALVILCGLGLVGGVFGCCCQKKKPSTEPNEETKDINVTNDNGVKASQDIPLVVNTR